jgi:hypothetical protein
LLAEHDIWRGVKTRNAPLTNRLSGEQIKEGRMPKKTGHAVTIRREVRRSQEEEKQPKA